MNDHSEGPTGEVLGPAPEPLRTTVGWIPDAAAALERLEQRTGHRRTDVINRAVQIYDFIDAELRAGKALIFRDPAGGEERVRLL